MWHTWLFHEFSLRQMVTLKDIPVWSASHFSQSLVFGLTLQYLQWPFCHTSWSHPPEQLNLKTKFDDGANQTTYLWRSMGHTLWNSTTHICIKDGLTWKKCAFDLIILELKEKWTWKQLETPGNMATNSFWVEVTKKRKNKLWLFYYPCPLFIFFGLLEQTVKREGDKAEHQVSVSCAVINTAASKNNTESKKSPWNHAHFVLCVF